MRRARRTGAGRKGAAATEFALILPLLIFLMLGGIDFGRFAYTLIAVQNGARAGGAYAFMNPFTTETKPTWDAAVLQAVEDEMSGLAVPGGFDVQLLVVTTTSTVDADGLRRVGITADYPFTTLIPWPTLPSNNLLRGDVEMRMIR